MNRFKKVVFAFTGGKMPCLFVTPTLRHSRFSIKVVAVAVALLAELTAFEACGVDVNFAASNGLTGIYNLIGNQGGPVLSTYRWNFGFQTGNTDTITASTFVITLNPPTSDPGGNLTVSLYSGLGGSSGSGSVLASQSLTYSQILTMPAEGSGFYDAQFKLTNFSASINNPNAQGYYSFELSATNVTAAGKPYGSKMQVLSASGGSGFYVVTGSVGGDTSTSIPTLQASPITGVTVQPAPEPSTYILSGVAAIFLAWTARKRSIGAFLEQV